MTGTGGFTGTGAMGVGMEKPLGLVAPKSLLLVKKKNKKTLVREAALRLVAHLLDETDSTTSGIGDGTG